MALAPINATTSQALTYQALRQSLTQEQAVLAVVQESQAAPQRLEEPPVNTDPNRGTVVDIVA